MNQARRILGRYELLEELGRGGMGVVVKVFDHETQRPAALKVLHLSEQLTEVQKEDVIKRFRREAKTSASLTHPNIVQVYEFGEEKQRQFIIMELLEGHTLKDLIEKVETPSLQYLIQLFIQICDALTYAHEVGVIHRDIKPENIFITPQNQVKVMDFGIARMNDAESFIHMTQDGTMLGTLAYMSPEQLQNSATVDHRADIYSMGALMYEACTGRLPFEGASPGQTIMMIMSQEPVPPSEISSHLPPEMDQIIEKCMVKRRGQRYQSAEELKTDLSKLLTPLIPASPEQDGLDEILNQDFGKKQQRTSPGGAFTRDLTQTNPLLGEMKNVLANDLKNRTLKDQKTGLEIEISADQMQGWLSLDPTYALEPATREHVQALLERAEIKTGINTLVIEKCLQEGYLEKTLLAEGILPQDGEDAWFEYLIQEDKKGPTLKDDGSVDFFQMNLLATVEPNRPVMRKHAATEGTPGITITGRSIQARNGLDRKLLEGRGTQYAKEDKNLLVAQQAGRPVQGPSTVHIDETIQLEEVGIETGHIDFDGTVLVAKLVHRGFNIKAGGDIVIFGSVEDCILEARGNIEIRGSLYGSEKASLKARGNIKAKFIQNARIECSGDLFVSDGIFHSQTRVVGKILLGVEGGKGQLNGGQTSCTHFFKSNVLGSPSATTTSLSLGMDPYIDAKITELENDLKAIDKKLEENIKSLIFLRTQGSPPERLRDHEKERTQLMIDKNTLTDEIQYIKLNTEKSLRQCQAIIQDKLHGGVRLNISGAHRILDEDSLGPIRATTRQINRREQEIVLEYTTRTLIE